MNHHDHHVSTVPESANEVLLCATLKQIDRLSDQNLIDDKIDELVDILFRLLSEMKDIAYFVRENESLFTDYLFFIFAKERDLEIQQKILTNIYRSAQNSADYHWLEDALLRISCFRDKDDYWKLVGHLNKSETHVNALKIIKNVSMYYLVVSILV